jgi:hypothetical protein
MLYKKEAFSLHIPAFIYMGISQSFPRVPNILQAVCSTVRTLLYKVSAQACHVPCSLLPRNLPGATQTSRHQTPQPELPPNPNKALHQEDKDRFFLTPHPLHALDGEGRAVLVYNGHQQGVLD